jgi:hypothetical protein
VKASASRVIMAVSKRDSRSAVSYQWLTRRMHGIMGESRYFTITHWESNSQVPFRLMEAPTDAKPRGSS